MMMTDFFRAYPKVFRILTDAAKTPIEAFGNQSLDNYAICWFMSASPESHMAEVVERVQSGEMLSGDTFALLASSLESTDAIGILHILGINAYLESSSYYIADDRFRDMIMPFPQAYRKETFEEFLKKFETCTNSQVISRGRALKDHLSFKEALTAIDSGIDLTAYPKFCSISRQ